MKGEVVDRRKLLEELKGQEKRAGIARGIARNFIYYHATDANLTIKQKTAAYALARRITR